MDQEFRLEVASGNRDKIKEFERILFGFTIVPTPLNMEEIQSLDPKKVAIFKAKEAYRMNSFNPILIEETSLSIRGLGGRPGPYIKDFSEDVEMRRMICERWLKPTDDRAALAKVILAVYDGIEVHLREGTTEGMISTELKGMNGFGWDDMFIPKGSNKTFAEMTDEEKDDFSMRKKALVKLRNDPISLNQPIFQIDEPYHQELLRVHYSALTNERAVNFAYKLECLEEDNPASTNFLAPNFSPIHFEENVYYTRYLPKKDSCSIGLILTDVDRSNLTLQRNGYPVIWQFGPERRTLAIAERADFFLHTQSEDVLKQLNAIEKGDISIPPRSNRKSFTVESVLGITELSGGECTSVYSWKDLGYRKLSSEKLVSRTTSARIGLYNKIGKFARSVFALGSMPAISGWRDVLVTAAIGHHAIFTHRNSIFAGYIERQADIILEAKKVLSNLGLTSASYDRCARNIGAALGCSNVGDEVKAARYLFKRAGVRLFRIYTINGDPRVIETARALRKEFGDEIELFVGQVSDKTQCLKLIDESIRVDGLFFGHGGGRQCTSATNGMAVTTLEEVYAITTDARFNHVTIAVEGGIGTNMGHLFLLGVDMISYNQQLAHCIIEQGGLFFEHKTNKICMPYHGSASAPTMIIESANPALARNRLRDDGRTRNVEGKAGYRFFEEKANSMVFYINTFKHYAARTLADVGVITFGEMREFLNSTDIEVVRVVSSQAS